MTQFLDQKAAEASMNKVTEQRILLWHANCSKELQERGLTKPEADAVAMTLFEQKCVPQRSYLGWPNADTAARAFDIESLDRGEGGEATPA